MPDTITSFTPIVTFLADHNIKRLAVVGSRNYPHLIHVDRLIVALPTDLTIITGGAKGVDQRAEEMARHRGMTVEMYRPEYDKAPADQKRRAPLARNQKIVDACEAMIAFHDGVSTGTLHAVNLARKAGKCVVVIEPIKRETGEIE